MVTKDSEARDTLTADSSANLMAAAALASLPKSSWASPGGKVPGWAPTPPNGKGIIEWAWGLTKSDEGPWPIRLQEVDNMANEETSGRVAIGS